MPENKQPNASVGAGFNQPALKTIENPTARTVAQALVNAKKQVTAAK